jgi:phosphoribosylaminoimidazolecarboxamide formyltransferase/IMP cyclohydrolase
MAEAPGGRIPIRRALLSAADKTGLVSLARRLADLGVALIASDGTAAVLDEAGVSCSRISDVTGAQAMLGGRVKTLHPKVHGGILADPDDPEHAADLQRFGIEPVQLVVVVPYGIPTDPSARWEDVIDHVDIGGPALIRAAAKNHQHVAVVVDPDQYAEVGAAAAAGGTDLVMRRKLAVRAFYTTARLDAAILHHLDASGIPERVVVPLERRLVLRYGENPDQRAAAYASPEESWWAGAKITSRDGLSATNLQDAEAALATVTALRSPAAVVVKHTNPCGAAEAATTEAAFAAAWEGDPRAAYGGVVALNAPLDAPTAEAIAGRFVELVVAPAVTPEAAAKLAARPRTRVIETPGVSAAATVALPVEGGLVIQERPPFDDPDAWQVVVGEALDELTRADLRIAWAVAAHCASNAVVLVRDGAVVGVGAGDQARVGAAERAVARAGERSVGAVAASDGLLPFRDGLDVLADAGIRALVEPGGSRRDAEVTDAASERGVTLVFTGTRRFRH